MKIKLFNFLYRPLTSFSYEKLSVNNLPLGFRISFIRSNITRCYSTIDALDSATSPNSLWSWFDKFNSNFKLPADFTIQLSVTYQSKTNLTPGGGGGFGGPPGARGGAGGGPGGGPGAFGRAQCASQGYIRPFYGVDIAVKKIFKE